MDSLLAGAESMSLTVRTRDGRNVEVRTSLLAEGFDRFSVTAPPELWDVAEPGQLVLVKVALPDSFLLIETRVVSLEKDPVARAELASAAPGRMRKIPRRQHFRVAASLPITFTFDRPGAKVPERVAVITAYTFDVSTGGVGSLVDRNRELVLPAIYATGDLTLTLVDSITPAEPKAAEPVTVSCTARVARVEPIHMARALLGLTFLNITEVQRMEVSRFVIAHQLALRRRGYL